MEELEEAAAEKLAGPAQILADVVRPGTRKAAEDAKQNPAECDLVPVVQPVGLALAPPERRVEILSGVAVADGLEPGEVVEPARPRLDSRRRKFEEAGHLFDTVEDAVAESDDAHRREAALGLAQLRERVRVVEEPRLGAVRLHRPRHLHGGSHVAQRVEEAARATVFSVDLGRAEGAGDVEVLRPVEVAAEFDRHHHRVGAGEGLAQLRGRRDGDGAPEPSRDGRRVRPRALKFRGVDVDEDDVQPALAQGVAEEQIPNGGGAELAAARADEDDLGGGRHAGAAGPLGGAVPAVVSGPLGGAVLACAMRTVRTAATTETAMSGVPMPARPVRTYPAPSRPV